MKSTLLLGVALAALSALRLGTEYLNHDPAWYVYMAGEWLRGATLYRDIVDTNPPLIVWLTAPPVALAQLTGWGAPALFKAYVFVIAGVALLYSARVAGRAWPAVTFPLVGAMVFLALPFVKEEFGQREHLAVLLTLPYILAAAAPAGVIPPRAQVWVGIAGALGFAIKPYFIPAWLAVEVVLLATRGASSLRRPQMLAAAATFAVYGVAMLLFVPQYFDFAQRILGVYSAMNASPAVLLRLKEVQLWLVAAALFAAIRWPRTDALMAVLFAAATGYLFGGLAQLKGWGYQLYPARVFVLLFLITAGAMLLEQVPALLERLRGGRRGAAMVFAATLAIASGRYLLEARNPSSAELVTPMIEAIRAHAAEGPVVLLGMRTQIYPAFPSLNYAGGRWGMRYNTLFFMPGLYAEENARAGGIMEPHTPATMPPLEKQFFEEVVEDLCATPPRLLVVDQPPESALAGRRALDFQAYYAQHPSARPLLASYKPAGAVGSYLLLVPDGRPSCAR